MTPFSILTCGGCGETFEVDAPLTFVCPNAGTDDRDHVLIRALLGVSAPDVASDNPFVRYRHRLHSYHRATHRGVSDAAFCETVTAIDARIETIDGTGFRVTPYAPETALADALEIAELWVKNETVNVSGSHKARHMMGIALHLAVTPPEPFPSLAIASCGNAGLAAATVAHATQRHIEVFLPESVDPHVHRALQALQADTTLCARLDGVAGDPSYHAFVSATEAGALPFTCQGSDNGLTIEGGCTLGYELAEQMADAPLDVLFIQVGGGALGSATAQGLMEVQEAGELEHLPQIHTVQTFGAYPLFRAYERLMARFWPEPGKWEDPAEAQTPDALQTRLARAIEVAEKWDTKEVQEAFRWAASHRGELMWPWESAPESVAHGILDDVTYDWLGLMRAMLSTGGLPIVADEATLRAAHKVAHAHTDINVDPTGTSGLAGLMTLRAAESLPEGARCGVLFTGVERG